MVEMPEEASGDDIIEGLMEHMDSEELIERFDIFAAHATLSPEQLESDEGFEEGVPYCVVALSSCLPINGKEISGIYVAIWPVTLAGDSDYLPTHLSRARHARFLEIDPKSDLVTEMHHLPTLH
jgi:hypothetical protein